ncbi:hypothetical protein LCGC14_2860390 [marine sediment metagenome]|uniref:Uncharacterized protein n=1 Tax=marine sediment metagenome TaxID=412755 RepID=A0A0F8Y617_9ZZZZ
MSKQEEIKRIVQEVLDKYDGNPAVDWPFILLFKLQQLGVVIKVDDNSYVASCLRDSWEEIKQDMKEAGYTAVEPLI